METEAETFAREQRMQLCHDKRTQDKVDREVVKRIRRQEHATAIVSGEKSGYKPSLIWYTIKGKDCNKMPEAVESETYGSDWAKYKKKSQNGSGSCRFKR